MRYEINTEWTQARINEAAERGDTEQVRVLTEDYDRRAQWNATTDWLDKVLADRDEKRQR